MNSYSVTVFDDRHQPKEDTEEIKANSPCHAVELWTEKHGLVMNGCATVLCDSGLTLTFNMD